VAAPALLVKTWTDGQQKKLGSRNFKHSTLLQLLLAAPHMDPFYLRLSEPPTVQNVMVRAQMLSNHSRLVCERGGGEEGGSPRSCSCRTAQGVVCSRPAACAAHGWSPGRR
jgi:hypothetical protein